MFLFLLLFQVILVYYADAKQSAVEIKTIFFFIHDSRKL